MSAAFQSVRTKILAAFLITAVGMVGASGFTLMKLRDTYRLVQQAETRQLLPTQHARGVLSGIYAVQQASMTMNQLLLTPGGMSAAQGAKVRTLELQDRTSADAAALAHDDVPAAARAAVKRLLDRFADNDKQVRGGLAISLEEGAKFVARAASDTKLVADLTKMYDDLFAAAEAVVTALDKAATADQAKAQKLYDSGLRAAVVVLAGCILLALGIGLAIAQHVRRPLKQSMHVLEEVADGDLTQRLEVHGADEVGQLAKALNQTLSTVHDVIEQIESDASRLADLAERAERGSGASADTSQELAEMAGNLSAMISIFQTERSKSS